MKKFLIPIVAALFVAVAVHADDSKNPEVEAVVSAVNTHNDLVENSQQVLERAIAEARRAHAERVIDTKERLVAELRRAFRVAMRGDAPENAVHIASHIEAIEAQIDELKAGIPEQAQQEDDEDELMEGLHRRLVGVIVVGSEQGNQLFERVYHITPGGELTVLRDVRAGGNGYDVGQTYQGTIVEGYFLVQFSGWTAGGATTGRAQAFALTNQGLLVRHGTGTDYISRGIAGLARQTVRNYNQVHFESVEAFNASRPDETPLQLPTADDEPDEAQGDDARGDSTETDEPDDTLTFFGVAVR